MRLIPPNNEGGLKVTGLPSVVITRHKDTAKGKCYFAVVSIGDESVSRSFASRNTTRNWAVWAVENFQQALAQHKASQVPILEEAA